MSPDRSPDGTAHADEAPAAEPAAQKRRRRPFWVDIAAVGGLIAHATRGPGWSEVPLERGSKVVALSNTRTTPSSPATATRRPAGSYAAAEMPPRPVARTFPAGTRSHSTVPLVQSFLPPSLRSSVIRRGLASRATALIARPQTPTMPVAIYRFLGQPGALNYGQALAMSTLLMLVCAAGMLAIERFRVGEIGEF